MTEIKLVFMPIEDVTRISDQRRAEGLSASFEEMETSFISGELRRKLIRGINNKLTKRQKEVINATRKGLTTEEIAKKLGITKNEVNRLRKRAIQRLKCVFLSNR